VLPAYRGDCLVDLGALRDQEDLFGRVASSTTAFSVIESLCAEGCSRGHARRARSTPAGLGAWWASDRTVLDVDVTLIGSHSDKGGRPTKLQGRLPLPRDALLPRRILGGACGAGAPR
jgi:hypothetical protein